MLLCKKREDAFYVLSKLVSGAKFICHHLAGSDLEKPPILNAFPVSLFISKILGSFWYFSYTVIRYDV